MRRFRGGRQIRWQPPGHVDAPTGLHLELNPLLHDAGLDARVVVCAGRRSDRASVPIMATGCPARRDENSPLQFRQNSARYGAAAPGDRPITASRIAGAMLSPASLPRHLRRIGVALSVALAVGLGGCSFNLDSLPGTGNKETTAAAPSSTMATLDAAIKANPNDPESYYNRGLLYQAEAQHERAIADFSSANGLSARQAGALAGRAVSYLAVDKSQDAASDLDEAVRLEPENGEIWKTRGLAYERLGDNNRAAASFGRATALRPSDEEARAGFARVGGEPGKSYDPF
jgi:cytochrome c-type biogenesis protein CcmH/NrfG